MWKVKTKILATIGPATDSYKNLKGLIKSGTSGLRLNFSHGSYEYYNEVFQLIDKVCRDTKLPIPILLDLQGPKIRIGELTESVIEIFSGKLIEITIDDLKGTKEKISTSYRNLVRDAKLGDSILIDDGLIKLEVIKKGRKTLTCKIIEGGFLKPKKGMNLPDMKLSTASLTEKDLNDLEFALNYRIDFIALSFVRHPDDILGLKNWLISKGHNIPIIAKIEKPEAVENFEAILKVSDGIMVARGDLGVELPMQQVPVIQKNIIRRCNAVGKLVITATQMLESMINNPVPTRAEASDVANAVIDGTDVVMLSGETAVGKYPFATVKIMHEVIKTAESQNQFRNEIFYEIPTELSDNLFDSTANAFSNIANQVNAKVIVVFTHYGRAARVMAKYRPKAPIIAISENFETLNELNLHSGISPCHLGEFNNEEKAIKDSIKLLKKNQFVESGDLAVFTAGAPMTDNSRRNWIRFVKVD